MAKRGELRIEVVERSSGRAFAARLTAKSSDWPIELKKGRFLGESPIAAVDRAISHVKHLGNRGRG